MTAYVTITGKLLDERDDAIRILVHPNWDIWLPRSSIKPNGGLRIKRATGEVGADVAQWKIADLVRQGELPPTRKDDGWATGKGQLDESAAPEAADERFKRMGQEKT